MIPQSELLVYPEDWQRRSMRKPREIGVAKEETWQKELRGKLDMLIDADFVDTPLDSVIAQLRERTKAPIVVLPSVIAKAGSTPISVTLKGGQFGQVLKWVLQGPGLHMALQNEAIVISDQPISGAVVLRMYDVADIISVRKNFPGRELAIANAGGAGDGGGNLFAAAAPTDEAATKTISVDDLKALIQKNVSPQSWEGNTQVGIEQRAGSTMFITHTPEVHDQILELLNNLRNQDSLQVKMDMRLLHVRKNYFEEIGFDWTGKQGIFEEMPGGGHGYLRQNDTSQISADNSTASALPKNAVGFQQFTNDSTKGLVLQGIANPGNFLSSDQVSVIFSAVENESDLEQVARPVITCFNGQQANASFITQYAYIKDYQVVDTNMDPEIQVLAFGNLIDVKPVVSSDRKYVMMEVKPTSVDLVGTTTVNISAPRVITTGGTGGGVVFFPPLNYPIELPNVEMRGLRSTVMLPDKGSLLLGGYQESKRQRTHVGIPFLSHIPFLGRLFSRNGSYDDNRKIYYLLSTEILHLKEKEDIQ
jgi:type II secretory pathway component GspD/PulD (secretin)